MASKDSTERTAAEAAACIRAGHLAGSHSSAHASQVSLAPPLDAEVYMRGLLHRYEADLKFSNALIRFDVTSAASAVSEDALTRAAKGVAPPPFPMPLPSHGALAGIPFVLSSNLDVAASICDAGTPSLSFNRPAKDAAVVAALKSAGAVFLAHGNTNELGLGCTGVSLSGTVKNPYSSYGTVGGACGGCAAAVAGRVVPIALGVDSQGDVRIPAALCGVVGFRPTHGRYPREGMLSLSSTLDHVGILARTVEDVQLVDAVLCTKAAEGDAAAQAAMRSTATRAVPASTAPSPDAGDASAAAAVKIQALARGRRDRQYVARLQSNRDAAAARITDMQAQAVTTASSEDVVASLSGLRIGVPRRGFFDDLNTSSAAVIDAALQRLTDAGAVLVEVDFPGELQPSLTSLGVAQTFTAMGGLSARADASSDAPQHPITLCSSVMESILAYESVRELGAYLLTHTSPPPPPAKPLEETYDEEDEDPAAAARARAAAAAPKPLDTLINVTSIISCFRGGASDRAMLEAQRDARLATSANAYRSALVHGRTELKRAFHDVLKANTLAAIVYPTTAAPALAMKAGDSGCVEHNGTVVDATALYARNTRPASIAGLPALSIPCGLTKPKGVRAPGVTTADRLPVALEFVAASGEDDRLLALGRAFQKLQPMLPDPIVVARWGDGVTRAVMV